MSLRLKLAAASAAAVLILLVGAAAYYFMRQSRLAAASVDHTNEVRAQLERTLRTLVDAETGQRGYLLTGDTTYLGTYRSARVDVDHEIATLRSLTADNPRQQRRLDSLALVTDAKLVELNQTITLAQAGNRDSALRVLISGHGAGFTRIARNTIGNMQDVEATLLAARVSDYDRRQSVSTLVILLGSLAAAALSFLTVSSVRAGVVELEGAKDIIEGQSEELAQQLEESQRLGEQLGNSNEELQRLIGDRERLIHALARSNQELDQFAYVASHDLKAPLRGIANLSEWVEEDLGDNVPDDVRQKMDLIRGRVHRLEALIDGILQYSRAGRVRASTESVDVGALLHEVVELLAPPPEVSVTIGPEMPTLVSERTPLQQVFLNLISNAIKYNRRPGATINVTVRDAGRFYAFTVADNGAGIAPEYHERIFGIFQTLESRDKIEGTGIGLSVVKKMVELRGGSITIDSATGRGAAFTFEWPKVAEEREAA